MKTAQFALAVGCVVLLGTGCAATYVKARVGSNPLAEVERLAADEYAVNRVDDNTLELRDSWVWSSIGGLGWYTSHANLHYSPATQTLDVQYYLRSIALWTLYIPAYLDAEPGLIGAVLKGTMNGQLDQILNWSNASAEERRADSASSRFPPEG